MGIKFSFKSCWYFVNTELVVLITLYRTIRISIRAKYHYGKYVLGTQRMNRRWNFMRSVLMYTERNTSLVDIS